MLSMYLATMFLLLLLSYTPLTCAHNPFFLPATGTTTASVSQPPPPPPQETETPPPKYPFSSSTPSSANNNQTPFFPSNPSPPPSSSTFASFPANISLPQSHIKGKSVSPTFLAVVTLISVTIALLTIIAAVLFYCRQNHPHFDDDNKTMTTRSSSSSSEINSNAVRITSSAPPDLSSTNTSTRRNHRYRSTTSSEFLYLGCTRIDHDLDDDDDFRSDADELQGLSKMNSPELYPLSPLIGPPRATTATIGSGRLFASTAEPDFPEIIIIPSSSCSSSNSGSPAPSISSPILRSPESMAMGSLPTPPPLPPPPLIARDCETTSLSPPPTVAKPNSQLPSIIISPLSKQQDSFVFQNTAKAPISPQTLVMVVDKNQKSEQETPKPKLKPLHWDKVRASSDCEMVWDHFKSTSFRLNEEMIETLFVVNTPNSNTKETTRPHMVSSPNQENMVLDPKKSQNIAISLWALNVTIDEVCEALIEGNAATLGTELLECLLKMAPTKEEERKLKEYKDDSPFNLGTAERFLRELLDIPFAFKRVDAMLCMANFKKEVEYIKRSFETLEIACEELRNSRIFLKLLEAVLKTGNRMNVGTNRGDAHAFKLDTLLKLADVKGTDGKTTLLHFVVQEIIKSEGARLLNDKQHPKSILNEDAKCRKLGLQVISGISSELSNVKKSAAMDSAVLSGDVIKLSKGISRIREVTQLIEATRLLKSNEKFSSSMNVFVDMAEEEIIRIQAEESVALSLVKEITEYFHGNSAEEEAHPFRIFMIVKDFLSTLDRVCKDVGMINERTIVSSAHKFPVPVNPTLCTSEFEKMQQYSSDEESLMIVIDL